MSCGACCPALSGRYTGPCMSRWWASPPGGVNALRLGTACSSTASLHIILHGRSDAVMPLQANHKMHQLFAMKF